MQNFTAFAVALSVVVGASEARAWCDDTELELTDTFNGETFEQRLAPPGGVWFVIDDGTGDVVLEVDGEARAAELVADGPRVLAVRVPLDLVQDDDVVIQTEAGRYPVSVDAGAAPNASEPVLELSARNERIETLMNPCTIGVKGTYVVDVARIEGLVDSDLDPATLLLDAWIVAPGAPIPDDSAQRALDSALPRPDDVDADGAISLRLGREGAHDVHMRVRDPRTGLTSSIERVQVEVEPLSYGCTCSTSSPSDGALIIAMTALMLRVRRKRAQRATDCPRRS